MTRTEARFIQELQKSLLVLKFPVYCYKLPDMPISVPGKTNTGTTRFTAPRPFDLHVVCNGVPYAIEVKSHNKHTAWPFRAVEDHQISSLETYERAGGKSYICCRFQFDSGSVTKNHLAQIQDSVLGEFIGPEGLVRAALFFPVGEFVRLEVEGDAAGRKSIPLVDLFNELRDYTVRPLKRGLWDFSFLEDTHGHRVG